MAENSEKNFLPYQKALFKFGKGAWILLTLFYTFLIYNVLVSHWSFFGDGPGDLIVMALLTMIYVFLSSMHFFSRKFNAPWMNLIIILGSALYMMGIMDKVTQLSPEDDRRAHELKTYAPRGQRKLPPKTLE